MDFRYYILGLSRILIFFMIHFRIGMPDGHCNIEYDHEEIFFLNQSGLSIAFFGSIIF